MSNTGKTDKESTEALTLSVEPPGSGGLRTAPPASGALGAQRGGSKVTEEEAVASCE